MPTDVTGTDIIEEDMTHGPAHLDVRAGPAVRERAARGRDQPHAAEDAVGAARGHAGVLGHGARPSPQDRAAVLRARHAEPDRARGHVSAARGAARPLPVQRAARLPERRARGGRRQSQHHAHGLARGQGVHDRRADPQVPVARAAGAGVGRRDSLRRRSRARHAPERPERARDREEVRAVRRQRARDACSSRSRRKRAR